MNLQRHIWEGWTPQDFIDELQPRLDLIFNGNSWEKPMDRKELRLWCKDNQSYYKKNVPEVVNYFIKRYQL